MSKKYLFDEDRAIDIADAIRTKTGTSEKFLFSDLDEAILNIPVSGEKIPVSLSLDESSTAKIKALLTLNLDEEGIIIKNGIPNANLSVDSEETHIGNITTDNQGSGELNLPAKYDKIFVKFDGTTSLKNIVETLDFETFPKFTLQYYSSENPQLYIQALEGHYWDTFIDGEEVINDNGIINMNVTVGENHEIIYKSQKPIPDIELGTDLDDIIRVELPPLNSEVSGNFSEQETIKEIIFSKESELVYFDSCQSLEHVRLPDNLRALQTHMFYGCPNILQFTLPKGMEDISENVLSDQDNLKYYGMQSGLNISHNTSVLLTGKNLERLQMTGYSKLENNTNLSFDQAFEYLTPKHVSFTDDTNIILADMCRNVSGVHVTEIPVSCEEIQRRTLDFMYDSFVTDLPFDKSPLVRFYSPVVPEFVDGAGLGDTGTCILEIPRCSTMSDNEVMEHYYDELSGYFESVRFMGHEDKGNTVIDFTGDILFIGYAEQEFWDFAINNNENIVTLDGDLTTYNGKNINLTGLGNYPHTLCLNGGWTELTSSVFAGNEQITRFVFPHVADKICDEAFKDCKNLKTLIFYNDIADYTYVGHDAFTGLSSDCVVYVPESAVDNYREHEQLGEYDIVGYADSFD